MVMVPAGYHTHYPLLAACAALAPPGRPILELGSGDWSTAMLHWMCRATNRTLVTVDNDLAWLERYKKLQRPFHRVVGIEDWKQLDVTPPDGQARWGLVFVDHKPEGQRAIDIERVRSIADIVVAHDTQPEWEGAYGYEPVFARFKHRYDFREVTPFTTAVSDVFDLGAIFGGV